MEKINLLDKSIYNLISAGEVVENPSSVVKELVENSIDAGATEITIEIAGGGKDLIKVTDNGCGIDKNDFKKAFLPHATSKIKSQEDLNNIFTLGFRGEALASISAVSKVTLISKQKEDDSGYTINVEGGEFSEIQPVSCENGTSISVKSLFYNTPARYKFLRKQTTEQLEITNIVEKLMLCNPNVSIKYIVNNEIYYYTNGSGLENVIYTIYGSDFLQNLKPINEKLDDYILTGYISLPKFVKSNRTYQTFMVNGRFVNSYYVSSAVSKAYEDYLMKGKFPVYILNLQIPYDCVDVNVHPNKLEVKFDNQQKIYSLILNSVYKVVNDLQDEYVVDIQSNQNISEKTVDLTKLSNIESQGYSYSNDKNDANIDISEIKAYDLVVDETNLYSNSSNKIADNISVRDMESFINYKANSEKNDKLYFSANIDRYDNNFVSRILNNKDKITQKESMNQTDCIENNNSVVSVDNFIDKKPNFIGYLFNLFLLYELDDDMYIIDQHACHERINYDKLVEEVEKNGEIAKQNLLVPYIFNVNSVEKIFIDSIIDNLNEIGFEVSYFGNNSYRINAIPYVLNSINLKAYIDEILSLNDIKFDNLELVKEKLMQKACKASIKAGDLLSTSQVEYLLKEICSGEKVLQCPHGRPIFVKVNKTEIEKWFKRIV